MLNISDSQTQAKNWGQSSKVCNVTWEIIVFLSKDNVFKSNTNCIYFVISKEKEKIGQFYSIIRYEIQGIRYYKNRT